MAHFLAKQLVGGWCVVLVALLAWFAPPVFSQVTVLEVGPSGTYATIQGAIDAVVNGADTEIRVEQNLTYNENLVIPDTFNSGSLSILGGWDGTFSTWDSDPEHTVIDGGVGSVLDIEIEGGSFLLDAFTITGGTGAGAGIQVRSDPGANTSHVVIRNNYITENVARTFPTARGGGILAEPRGTQRLEIVDCLIFSNSAESWNDGKAVGGGIFIESRDDSTFLIEGCDIGENSIESEGGIRSGAGVFLRTSDNSAGTLVDTFIVANSILGTGTSIGSGGFLDNRSSANMIVSRSGWAINVVDAGEATSQLVLTSAGTLRFADSGLAQGDDGGLDLTASSSATVHLVNLTVADHPGTGILATQEDSSTLAIYNTIAYGNGTDLTTSGTVDTGSNLVGVDPLFLDPLNLDYYLTEGSPAENMGDNYPPGGLSPVDIEGSSRVVDGIVDIGFAEGIDVIFACSFETGDTSTWVDDAD